MTPRLQWHFSLIPMVSLLAGRSVHFWTNLHNHRKLCVTVRQRVRLMLGLDNPMRPICKACLSFSSSFSAFTEKSVSSESTGISGQISSMDREIVVKLHPIADQGNIKTMSYNKADGKCKLWYFTIHLPKWGNPVILGCSEMVSILLSPLSSHTNQPLEWTLPPPFHRPPSPPSAHSEFCIQKIRSRHEEGGREGADRQTDEPRGSELRGWWWCT